MNDIEPLNIFLLMGQSNMSGRGKIAEVPELQHPDIYMWRDRQWIPAREPLHVDKPEIAGIGLGMSFAVEIANQGFAPVGLVPCAVGGSPLRRWMPGEDLYEAALAETRAALAYGTLAGFLWHQGEHDSCGEEMATTYGERLVAMIAQLRADLDAENVPFIAGGLGEFLGEFRATVHFKTVNRVLHELGSQVPNYTCVSSEGLKDVGDSLHFDAVSLHEFGKRYAQAFIEMQAARKP